MHMKNLNTITRAHIIQCTLAGAYIFFVFLAMNSYQNDLALASMGASAFIAFSSPNDRTSTPRFLLAGYCIAAVSGLLCHGLGLLIKTGTVFPSYVLACAFAVFLAMLVMTLTNLKQPTTAALAVAFTLDGHPAILSLAGLGCTLVLCLIKELMKRHLKNL